MATHSSILSWRILGTEKPGGLPSVGLHRVRHNCSNLAAAAYTVEYYSAIKNNEIMPFAATWMDLKIVILSEVSQAEKGKYMTLFIC